MFVNEKMIEVCFDFTYNEEEKKLNNIVVAEPYIPYIPDSWNGILVLAESQNLAHYEKYTNRLMKKSFEGKVMRLYEEAPKDLGVKPWDDDGYIKFALKVMYPKINLDQVSVCNAVPWSRAREGVNANPNKEMKERAGEFWNNIFSIWIGDNKETKLQKIITLGTVAYDVISKAKMESYCIKLAFPSPRIMNNVMCMFDDDDLMKMLPEIFPRVKNSYPGFIEENPELNKNERYMILYACHAVNIMQKTINKIDKQKILKLLSEHREEIQKFSVKSLALFGSAVRGELSYDSDIDFLVELEKKTFDNFMGLNLYLEELFNRKVDLGLKDSIKPGFEKYILAEAVDVPGFN